MSDSAITASHTPAAPTLETVATLFLLLFVATVPLSIAAAHMLLTVTLALWTAILVTGRERPHVPALFWPLAVYAGVTLVAALFSRDPWASFVDSKQLVLFLIVPAVYRLARGQSASTVANVIVSVGAVAAVFGVIQYGLLGYDYLGQRPRGSLGHYMTYSGLLMLVIGLTVARMLFGKGDRMWPGLVLPTLLVALAMTFTRSAWVGACVAIGVLLLLKDRRLFAVVPVVAALFLALAPPPIANRFYSMFDVHDPTNRDRFALVRAGAEMVRDHPLTGVGPNMVQEVYDQYRDEGAVEPTTAHLHNVPLQIAAERGVPALAVWLWFVVVTVRGLLQRLKDPPARALAAAGLAAVGGMLAAGLFDYNFGDSEVLMLFLVLLTLPHAVVAETRRDASGSRGVRRRSLGASPRP